MTCLETRRRSDGLVRRRHATPEGVIATLEVPVSVLRAVGMLKVREALARFRRGQAARLRAAELRANIAAVPTWKATAAANEFGCTEARVRQIRKQLEDA